MNREPHGSVVALIAMAPLALTLGAGAGAATAQEAASTGHLDRLTGPAWLAEGDGFTSVLTYEWAVPGRVLTAENILFDDAGRPVGHYRGAYQIDPLDGTLEFWLVGPDRERHTGEVGADGEGLWHRGLVGGGGYRSLVTLRSDTVMQYRASREGPDVPDGAVLDAQALLYTRLSPAALRAAAEDERAYMARDGGEWWAPNPTAGADAPERFLYRSHEAGQALRVDIVAELADGRSFTAWRITSSFDADPGVIRMHQVGSAGALMEGRMDPLPDGSTVLRMNGNGPDGADVVFMDRNVRDGPDTFRSVSWLLVDGAWQESMRSTWRRVQPPASPDSVRRSKPPPPRR